MKILAIIPARGGSKRIERKNVRPFDGLPIIAYSIRAALSAGCFEKVMVSTDDEEIAEVARKYGAEVPFMRSTATADDYATTADVISEVLRRYRQEGFEFDAVCCLYATAPFVTAARLCEGAAIIENGNAKAAFTCVAYSYPTQRCLVIGADGCVSMKYPQYAKSRSQDLERTYHDAGQFYFCSVAEFEKYGTLWVPDTFPVLLPELEVQDLDTPTDWKIAEIKYRLISMPGSFRGRKYEFLAYPDMPAEWNDVLLKERNAGDVRKNMVNTAVISEAEHRNFLKSLAGRRDKQYYLVLDSEGEMIGSVNLERLPEGDIMERGIWIGARQRGKGHARELLKELYSHLGAYGVEKVLTRVRNENTASLGLEKSLGAVPVKKDDEYCTFITSIS
ncbi:MAG: pseudaminic acid cytidylyltransferase [Bacteroides sp.]|nr:pseudaminic acid cytidylyltransferase [Bacteroides sp.]